MYQCNLIIVKSNKSMECLIKNGYKVNPFSTHPDGWTSWSCPKKLYIDQMVGSRSKTLIEEGKYPYELSAVDYKRAIQKETEFLESVLSKLKEDDFWEKRRKDKEYCSKAEELTRQIIWLNEKNCLSEKENILLQEKSAKLEQLNKIIIEMVNKDKMYGHACMYAGGGYKWGEIQIREKQREINSNNYGMHEYYHFRKLFSKLLQFEPYIYFTYEDESEKREHELVNIICLSDLQIGDLAMLCSYDVLKICRKFV